MKLRNILTIGIIVFIIISPIFVIANDNYNDDSYKVMWHNKGLDTLPNGKLLSDNIGYFGNVIITNCSYEYLTPIKAGGDSKEDTDKFFSGKRLIDGDYHGWSVYTKNPIFDKVATVVFDFNQICDFNEIDVKSSACHINIYVSNNKTEYEKIVDKNKDARINRFIFPVVKKGQYIKIELTGNSDITLEEVYAWGNAKSNIKPIINNDLSHNYDISALESIKGITNTKVMDSTFKDWKSKLIANKITDKIVISQIDPWKELSKFPILPKINDINKPINVYIAKNEIEPFAVTITNTAINIPFATNISVSDFKDKKGNIVKNITGEPFVFGAINTKNFGAQLSVLFSERNKLGRELINKYCLNGNEILDFPNITLSPAGSEVLWIKIKTSNATPGDYKATLNILGGKPININIKVLDINLDYNTKRLVHYWSTPYEQYPFEEKNIRENEANTHLEIGTSVVEYFPSKDPLSYNYIMAQKKPDILYRIFMGNFGHLQYAIGQGINKDYKIENFNNNEREKLRNDVLNIVKNAKDAGLSYDQYYIEGGDEPNAKMFKIFGEMMKEAKKADPNINIYCNPCGWLGLPEQEFEPDEDLYESMKDWYNKTIDVSVPAATLLTYKKTGDLLKAKRKYNGLYDVITPRANSEDYDNVNAARKLTWIAIKNDFNGWSGWSFYWPYGDPWNDFDYNYKDPQMVYPGPNGFIPTRQYEGAREGFEDWLLMNEVKKKNKTAFNKIIKMYNEGATYSDLRIEAMKSLVKFNTIK